MKRSSFTPAATALALIVLGAGCAASSAPAAPPASAQSPTTSDGEVVGADRTPPSDKLEQGISLDSSGGVKPAEKPPEE